MRSIPLRFLVFFASVCLLESGLVREARALTADDYHAATQVGGWNVRVEKSLDAHPRRAEALTLLQTKLAAVSRALPRRAIPKLRQVTIWLSANSSPGAAYHPSADWLRENGRVVEMEKGIEIQNIDHFIDWSAAQPSMVLHELAHAWHHRFLPGGFDNPSITSAYRRAVRGGKYRSVLYYDGTRKKAYALTDAREFFAEITEAYFGRNDFHPFNRRQLRGFDRAAYRLIEKAWGVAVR